MPSDVRRSARGAPPPAQPPPPKSTSSSSSLSSSRKDQVTRANNQPKSTTPHSYSSEDTSEPPRRSQRSAPLKEEEVTKAKSEVDGGPEDDEEEEEEITRCICGQQEYPGPPLSEAFSSEDAQSEDAGSLFISCDGCSVWQHGGCVGIVYESQVPDKYFCDECRPKLHDLQTDAKGQNYSLYQPVNPKSKRSTSVSKPGEKGQKERDSVTSRTSVDPPGRRRGTIRSKEHDDEEEQMARAIEQSKREVDAGKGGKRNGKRQRDDSEDNKNDAKRQRRVADAGSAGTRTGLLHSQSAAIEDSDDEPGTLTVSKVKKARADAAQSARQAQVIEKEQEREKTRQDAAGRRQQRAGRRRVDEEPSDDTPNPNGSAKTSPPPSSQPASPPSNDAPEKLSHKKGAGKRVKKLGNNQYTKFRESSQQPVAPSPQGKKRQTTNNQSASSGDEPLPNGNSHPASNSNGTNKNSPERVNGVKAKFAKGKGKGVNALGGKNAPEDPADLTMLAMKRRMDAMAAFIAKAQLELAGDRTPASSDGARASGESNGLIGVAGGAVQPPEPGEGPAGNKKLEEMSASEMAETVTKSITNWQSLYSHLI